MKFVFVLSALVTLGAARPTLLLDSLIIHKAAQVLGIDNVISVDGSARAKLGENEVGVDVAGAIGGDVVGYHASADANVLGQQAHVNANIYDGDIVDARVHEVQQDAHGRYVLVRQYVGNTLVYKKQYIDATGKIIIDQNVNPVDITVRQPDIGIRRVDTVVDVNNPNTYTDIRNPSNTVNIDVPNGYKLVKVQPGINTLQVDPYNINPVYAVRTVVDPIPINNVQVNPANLKPVQIDPISLKPVQIDPISLKPVQIDPINLKPVQIDPINLKPVQVDPINLRPVQVDPVNSKPLRVTPSYH